MKVRVCSQCARQTVESSPGYLRDTMKFRMKIIASLLFLLGTVNCTYEANCSASDMRCNPILSTGLFIRTCYTQGFCKIFATSGTWFGDLGGSTGVSGADRLCNADANRPAGGGFYAALISDGITRIATVTSNIGDGQVGWVMYPNMEYRLANGSTVWTTNSAGLFVFGTVTNQIAAAGTYYTGMDAFWVSSATCLSWTDGTGGNSGRYGTGGASGNTVISLSQSACNSAMRGLYCVQR